MHPMKKYEESFECEKQATNKETAFTPFAFTRTTFWWLLTKKKFQSLILNFDFNQV